MITVRVGQGIYYSAIREGKVVRCRGDEDRPEDRQEARDEERAVEMYLTQTKRR